MWRVGSSGADGFPAAETPSIPAIRKTNKIFFTKNIRGFVIIYLIPFYKKVKYTRKALFSIRKTFFFSIDTGKQKKIGRNGKKPNFCYLFSLEGQTRTPTAAEQPE
jgi:hypothetical protein